MTFYNLNETPDCNCLEEATEDYNSRFAIKTNRAEIRENDFKTKWENGDTNVTTCIQRCGKKGKSFSLITENNGNLDEVVNIYREIFSIAPGYRPYCTIITLGENSGVVKSTPSRRNSYHHDFYKCDDFKLASIAYIESIPLAI